MDAQQLESVLGSLAGHLITTPKTPESEIQRLHQSLSTRGWLAESPGSIQTPAWPRVRSIKSQAALRWNSGRRAR